MTAEPMRYSKLECAVLDAERSGAPITLRLHGAQALRPGMPSQVQGVPYGTCEYDDQLTFFIGGWGVNSRHAETHVPACSLAIEIPTPRVRENLAK